MAANKKNYQTLAKKLKKQVRIAQRREIQARNKLRTALKKIRNMARSYKSKLAGKIRIMKGKLSEVQATVYSKIAADINRQIENSIEKKRKAISAALSKIEKKQLVKLSKSVAKKGKKPRKKTVQLSKKSKKVKKKGHKSRKRM